MNLLPMRRAAIVLLLASWRLPPGVAAADFERDFAAVIVKHCISCHNPSEAGGKLDLSRREPALKGGKSGPAFVAGKPHESYLVERISNGTMPPPKKGTRLNQAEIKAVTAWIKDGAHWPAGRVLSEFELSTDRRAGYDWWSLQPIKRPNVPRIDGTRNPIDAFLIDAQQKCGLSMAGPADPLTLIRRATFDLVGLPPTPAEIGDFLREVDDPSTSASAYEKLLDRLLASPHYGERWGRHWLDVARYTESDGFENDKLRDHAWHYRDYVIRAFNEDRPYPKFVREQLAGDAIRPFNLEALRGSGFLVAGPWDEIQNVAASQTERQRAHEEQMEELLAAVGQTFLGLTVHCARCHDHKFDPISQEEYYRLKAVFDGVDHGNVPVLPPDDRAVLERRTAPIKARVADLKRIIADGQPGVLSPAALVDGRFGKAIDPRRGKFELPGKADYQQPPLSVECWARLDSKRSFNILVASNLKEAGDHWELYSYAGTGDFSVYLPGYVPAEIRSGIDITDGRWHYLAMTFDGSHVRLLIDAKLVKEATVKQLKPAGAPGRLWFGAYPPQQIGCEGVLDEVRISRGVRNIAAAPGTPFVKDHETLGLWHFDAPEMFPTATPTSKDPNTELKALEAELAQLAPPLVYAGVRRQPAPTHVFLRGDIKQLGSQVRPSALRAVRGLSADLKLTAATPEAERRLRFADWVAHPDNPLTPRVLVNRLWQYHFGQGLVATPSDFGFNGGRPSHPELLDWLAREYIDGGWSIKRMHKLMLMSVAYRQSSQPLIDHKKLQQLDADNRLLFRFNIRRLEGEIVRDAMLAVSGRLNPRLGGPSFKPFTVTVFLTHFYNLVDRDEPDFNRRSVYRANVNTGRSPLLDALDCPSPSLAAPRRRTTTTPMHALALMNDPFVLRQAERFARRVKRHAGDDLDGQLSLAYRLAFGRQPTASERDRGTRALRDHGLETLCWALLNTSEFLYVR